MPKLKDPNVWFQNARRVTEDPAASDWLKHALLEAINRDPVDAAGDAEVLCRILKLRAAAVQRGRNARARQANRRRRRHRQGLSHDGQPAHELPFGQGFVRPDDKRYDSKSESSDSNLAACTSLCADWSLPVDDLPARGRTEIPEPYQNRRSGSRMA